MKIGIITTSFPRWKQDYVGSFIYEAARAIQNQGMQVKVITIHSPNTPIRESWDGIEIYRTKYLPNAWELLKSQGGGIPEVWRNNRKARIQIIPLIIAFLYDVLFHTRDCDLLHANWTLSGVITWINYLFYKKPYIVTIHGSDIYRTRNIPIITGLTRKALNNSKKVIVVSKALGDVIRNIGVLPSKIEVIPDGVDINRFSTSPYEERSNTILYVGSLIPRKGVAYLIQAFVNAINHLPETNLVLMGEGPLRSELEQLVRSFDISERVFFAGGQSQVQVAEGMRKAKVFVLPSIEEGLGVVLLEALAAGTPVIGSKVGGIIEVIDSNVGILTSPGDSHALEEAILAIFRLSLDDWNNMHLNARKKAEEAYDWERIAQRLISLYRN